MSEKKQDLTLQAARGLLDHIAEPINSQLKVLLQEGGASNKRQIDKLLYEHENIRRWMNEQTGMQGGTKGASFEFKSVPGELNSISASKRWVCPRNKRDHWMLVIQEGEAPPTCREHNIQMVREKK
ncbi:MAG: hypothetical protein ACM3XO_13340 [Bacteroidota bacterium]